DTFAVFVARFVFTNTTTAERTASLPIVYRAGEQGKALRLDEQGFFWAGANCRGQLVGEKVKLPEGDNPVVKLTLQKGEGATLVTKIQYVVLREPSEKELLGKLDFEKERLAVAGYWRKRLNESARLITPEPV